MLTFETAAIQGTVGIIEKLSVRAIYLHGAAQSIGGHICGKG